MEAKVDLQAIFHSVRTKMTAGEVLGKWIAPTRESGLLVSYIIRNI